MTSTKNTEEVILQAAREVFMQKGFAATRMCDIAKTADLNQALLHYYFRKKDKLFEIIFEQESRKFYADFLSILQAEIPFFEKIKRMVTKDIQKMAAAPYLPMFILNEMHSNPERIRKFHQQALQQSNLFEVFSKVVEEEQKNGRIRPVDPRQLFLSIIGLTTFPFLAQPMIKQVLQMDNHDFHQLISERIDYASDLLIRSLQLS